VQSLVVKPVRAKMASKACASSGKACASGGACKSCQSCGVAKGAPSSLPASPTTHNAPAPIAKDKEQGPAPTPEGEALRLRELGNDAFKRSKADALALYLKSIEAFPTAPAHSNAAGCLVSVQAFSEAEDHCKAAIRLDPAFVKVRAGSRGCV
jgi:hypothetical protein